MVQASLLVVPASAALMRREAAVRKRVSGLTDARVKLCAEIVSGEKRTGRPRMIFGDAVIVDE